MDGEVETFHESTTGVETEMEEEVVFRERSTQVERPSPSLITANDMDVIIKGWEEKFEHLAQRLRTQLASEKANSTIYDVPHRRDAHGADAILRKMRPHAPHSTTQRRGTDGKYAI